jgi:hypothetical protein
MTIHISMSGARSGVHSSRRIGRPIGLGMWVRLGEAFLPQLATADGSCVRSLLAVG